MVDYFPALGRSFADVCRRPVLLVPFLLQMLAVVLLALVLAAVGVGIGAGAAASGMGWSAPAIAAAAVGAVIAFALLLVLAAWFSAGALGMVDDVTEGRPTGKATFFAVAKAKTWRILWLKILGMLLFLAAAIPAVLFIASAAYLGLAQSLTILFIALAVLFGLAFLVAAFFLGALLVFTQPIVIREDVTAPAAIAKGYRLLKEKAGHVLLSFLLVLGTGLVLGMGLGIVTVPFDLLAQLHPGVAGYAVLDGAMTVLRILLQLYLSVVILLFTFRMYLAGWPGKARKKKAR